MSHGAVQRVAGALVVERVTTVLLCPLVQVCRYPGMTGDICREGVRRLQVLDCLVIGHRELS